MSESLGVMDHCLEVLLDHISMLNPVVFQASMERIEGQVDAAARCGIYWQIAKVIKSE